MEGWRRIIAHGTFYTLQCGKRGAKRSGDSLWAGECGLVLNCRLQRPVLDGSYDVLVLLSSESLRGTLAVQ